MWTDGQIRQTLHEMLIEVLGVEGDELAPDARFVEDLGSESIDILELSFLSEKRFGQKVEFQKMISPDELELDTDRRLTEASIEKVGATLPFVDIDDLRRDPRVDSITRLLTVENLYQFLRQTLLGISANRPTAGG